LQTSHNVIYCVCNIATVIYFW